MHGEISQTWDGLTALCRRYDFARLEVFGTAARGAGVDPVVSDADFLVKFNLASQLPPLEQFFGLAEALGQLLGRPVDLVEAGANPFLHVEIDKAREIVYAQ